MWECGKGWTDRHIYIHTNRLVFTARLRPQFRMPPVRNHGIMRTQHFWIRTSVVDCCCTPSAIRGQYCRGTLRSAWGCRNGKRWNRHRGKIQSLSPPSVLFESSPNFFTIHWRHRCKKWRTRILKFEFCDFWEFYEIFKKVSRGPSAADLDHYGPSQTRSQ